MITILTTTCRAIYKNQIEMLKMMNFKDFEWILVDDHYSENEQSVKNMIGDSFKFKHLPPREISPYTVISAAFNEGLKWARGELIYFMNDYIYPHNEVLNRHWDIYQKYHNVMISGGELILDEPCETSKLITGEFVAHDYRLYLFKEGLFRWEKREEHLYEIFRDGIQNWWAGRNDSCPLEALLAVNGFEEDFDGAWGGHDADIAQRLMTYGLRYLYDTKISCLALKHEHSPKQRIRSEEDQKQLQFKIIDRKAKDKVYKSNNNWDLREERNKCLIDN